MLPISPHLSLNNPQFTSKPPIKKVTIITKNGRDVIKDQYIGYHVVQPNLLETISDIFEDIIFYLSKFIKKIV